MNAAEGFPSGLFAQHRAIEALLRQLDRVRTRGGLTDDEDLRLLAALRRLLLPHLAAEEEHLYPLARRCLPGGRALADAAGRTHASIRRLLDRADDHRLSVSGRRRATTVLLLVLRTHLRGEEEQLFPALRARARPDELRRCERRLREPRAGPPGSPGSVGAAGSAGSAVWGLPPGAGAITALRDHLTGHDSTGQHSP
ncbi:hemerythrin domain-containing protein [Kitasatospora sp. NPDC101157]|uniref:hemerythrin domain-containing protein n=1 Tax=Kitasatospora sp. NPDC101157 TaxID=3364098 RepID=UPI0037FE9306